jgi:hypothetical protein
MKRAWILGGVGLSVVAACGRATPGTSDVLPRSEDTATDVSVAVPTANDGVELRGSGQEIHARFANDMAVSADVALPRVASHAFVVSSMHAGAKHFDVTATPVGASAAAAVVDRGLVHYRDAFGPGTDFMQRIQPSGTEDYVTFPRAPARPELRYQIALGDDVAGLRLVGNSLEMLDAAGAPRLRVASPYGVDANGKRFDARLALAGCAADTDPRAPWGRSVVAPGSKSCSVVVSWNAGVAYPATVDPAWTTTGDMSATNVTYELPTVVLSGGKVLAVPNTTVAQLYDPATGTWANTGASPISFGHRSRLVAVGGNQAWGSGGYDPAPLEMQRTALYDLATGLWTAKADTPNPSTNYDGKATVYKAGNIVLLFDTTGTVHEYDVAGDTYTAKTPAGTTFGYNMGAWKVGNDVFIQGSAKNTLSKYDIAGDTWTFYASNLYGAATNTGQLEPLSGGKLLAWGGCGGAANYASVFDPATDTKVDAVFPAAPSVLCQCFRSSNVTFAAGKKHLIGGGRFLYDEATGLITDNGPMASGVDAPSVVVKLQDGRALAAGATLGGTPSMSAKTDLFGASAQADCSTGGDLFVAAKPVFEAASLQCKACNADNGAAAGTLKCPTTGVPACQTGGANPLLGQCTECSATKLTQCTGVKPTCNATTGACIACDGGFGSTATQACTTAALPACKADGSCVVANGDFGTAATAPCPTAVDPFVKADGSCGKCTTNVECASATHGGPICNTTAGSCGVVCALDTDCAAGSFCDTAAATRVCTPKKADGAACAKASECTTAQCNGGKCGPAATADAGTSGAPGSSGAPASSGDPGSSGAPASSGGGGGSGGCSTTPSRSSGLSALALVAMVGLAIRSRRRRDD